MTPGAAVDIDSFADIPVSLEVRLGCKETSLDTIANLAPGATLLLDRAAGETFDLFVGGVRLASAEVVISEGDLAIRITDLLVSTVMTDTVSLV